MKRIKLIELIKEIIQEAEVEKATIGDLEFGKNVFEKDVITNGSYNLVINNAENLESWKLGKLNLIIFEEEKKKGVPSPIKNASDFISFQILPLRQRTIAPDL